MLFGITLEEWLARILLVGLFLLGLSLLRYIITRSLGPVAHRIAERSETDVDDILLRALGLPFNLLYTGLIVLVIALLIIPAGPSQFTLQIVRSLVIVAAAVLFYQLVGLFMRTTWIFTRLTGIIIHERLMPFLRKSLQLFIIVMAILIVLQEWNYNVSGLIAGLGVAGLAVSLAAQDTLANLFGFTTIIGDNPLSMGDFISTPDVKGTVEEIGVRSTRVRQIDQALVTIPNSKLANSVVTNISLLQKRRMDVTIGVTYDTNSQQMRDLLERLEDLLFNNGNVIDDSINVLFVNFGGSSLDVRMIAQLDLTDWGEFMRAQQELLLQIMDIVEEMGLAFAFPSQSLYIEQMPGSGPVRALPDNTEQID
ncbi:mechanosensitive ion channel family protein [Chloroflexota bacterium]